MVLVYWGETMRLIRMRVTNFSSFKDTGWIEFSSGVNLIVGQNNAGKSALLRVFDQQLEDNRHRNADEYRQERLKPPSIYFDLVVSGPEVEESILKWRGTTGGDFSWPIQTNNEKELEKIPSFLSEPVHIMKVCRYLGGIFVSPDNNPIHGQFEGPVQFCAMLIVENGQIKPRGLVSSNQDTLVNAIGHLWPAKVFSFNAQRSSIGRCRWDIDANRLFSDASNLAAILFKLQGEQGSLFERLVEHLSEMFSTIQNLSITQYQLSGAEIEVRVWPTKERLQPQLGFPLEKCGTGVAQAIAILAVVMTFEQAIIVIDEISSFLHPAAAKALLRVIQTNYPQHQYIIATHSPEVLSARNPATVHVVRRHGYDSFIEKVDLHKLDRLRDVADDLGISMTDFFGAERIIWVEGRTEELCFPFLFEKVFGQLPRGVIVTPVIATGDFNSKRKIRRDLVFQIYHRVHQAASPLVKSATFGFDRETLTDEEMRDLKEKAAGRVLFLLRRHFECYLLDPAAIAAFINNRAPEIAKPVSHEDVLKRLQSVGENPKFKTSKQWNGDIFDEKWLAEVDAAELLKETCYQLTENCLAFSKMHHSLELLQHILTHNRTSLVGLIAYVKELYEVALRDAD
jgi:predicted ATPase